MARRIPLYNLPAELLSLILDHLNVQDILNLTDDSEFPVGVVSWKHIENNGQGGTILHTIAETGWTQACILQIQAFTQILRTWDTPHSYQNLTPLGIAAFNGHYELCCVFLKAGAHVDPPTGTSPLWIAASKPGNDDVITLLVQHGADVSWIGPSGIPVIFNAVEHANADTVNLLIRSGADVNFVSKSGSSPLHQVTDSAVAKLLIEHGADVNVSNHAQKSPLIIAAECGHSELTDVYIDSGAEIDYYGRGGLTALTAAIMNGHTDVVRKLIFGGCEFNKTPDTMLEFPVLLAIRSRNIAAVKVLLENGVDVITPRSRRGENALSLAARQQSQSLFRDLIDAGAEIDAKDMDGRTPLFKAIDAEDENIVRLLLDSGADVSHVDNNGMHPTLILSAGSEISLQCIVEYFTEYGIDWITECDYFIDEDDENLYSNTSILNLLLGHGTDISGANYQGIGILHFAAWRNDEDLVKLLLEHGADSSYKDPCGNTPAAWAAMMENPEIEELLRSAETRQQKA